MAKVVVDDINLKNTADAIREKTGDVALIKPPEFAAEIPKVYKAGEDNGLKKAWDTKTGGMTSGNAQYWFYSEKIDTGILEYPLTYKVTGGADSTFRGSKGEVSLLDIERNGGVKLDWSGCISFNLTFQNSQITEFGIVDARGVTGNFNTVFGAASVSSAKLRYIEKLCVNKNIPLDTAFKNAAALVHVIFEGTIGKSCDIHYSPLDKESLTSLLICLSDNVTGQTCSVNKAAVNRAFETSEGANDGTTSPEWLALVGAKPNWTVALMEV